MANDARARVEALVTEQQAQAVLAAVREQFRAYLEPFTIDGTTYSPTCGEPVLGMDFDGHPAIVWQDGPAEWAHLVTEGGTSEEARVLAHDAAVEFGVPYIPPAGVAPATMPPGVSVEPVLSFILGIYADTLSTVDIHGE